MHLTVQNPFASQQAIENSCYVRFDPGPPKRHVLAATDEPLKWALAIHVHDQLAALIRNPAFPCVLGRSAIMTATYRFGCYRDMRDDGCVQGLCRDLYYFTQEQPDFDNFSTFLASFDEPVARDEFDFEALLWNTLQTMNDHDARHFRWDPAVASDPDDPRFSFSFAGRAFFVIGLHAHSSRLSRRFSYPTLVFNSHDQFDVLRREGKFEQTQQTIRKNDGLLQGDFNPSLANYGDDSEAKQYSGRLVEPDWKCTFRAKNGH